MVLPPSALDRLASLRIDYPMLFKLENPQSGRSSHCGVMEFVANEGTMCAPRPPPLSALPFRTLPATADSTGPAATCRTG